jgi:anti-anti-sigma factor
VKVDHVGEIPGDRPSIMLTRHRPTAAGTATVQLRGEIDHVSAAQVAGLADALGDATVIILDMSRVSFLGAAGLTALLRLAARLSLTGRHLVLTGTDRHPVRRPLEICGLHAVLDCRPIVPAGPEKSST